MHSRSQDAASVRDPLREVLVFRSAFDSWLCGVMATSGIRTLDCLPLDIVAVLAVPQELFSPILRSLCAF